MLPARVEPVVLLIAGALALLWSALAPYDRLTWWLETFPIFIALPVLLGTARRFPLTPLVYRLVLLHALVLMLGGHYSYARVPLGYWLQNLLALARNPYDRIGHLMQGFVPAIVTREILLRVVRVPRGGWLLFLVTAVCLAISATYELIEWATALVLQQSATDFLGTQGDPWDTQWDMFCALLGALLAQVLLARVQDRQLRSIGVV